MTISDGVIVMDGGDEEDVEDAGVGEDVMDVLRQEIKECISLPSSPEKNDPIIHGHQPKNDT